MPVIQSKETLAHDAARAKPGMLSSLRKMFAAPRPANYHRRWPRILMSEPAKVIHRNAAIQAALLEQICAGGARLKVASRLAPGTTIGLQFKTSAGERSYELVAVVVHTAKEDRGFNWRCGICFLGADAKETQRLSAFVDAERKRREHGIPMARA